MTPKECERIYNEAYRAVYWTAISLLKKEADAEDVVQDTFVTLLESYDTLQDKTKVVPWLKKICANKCLNRLTRTKTEAVEPEFFDDTEYVSEDFLPESVVESKEKRKIIMDIIDRTLSEDIRRTLILYYFDEMNTKEISEALEIPQGTVLWRLGFARKKIKKEVEKYERETDTKLYSAALPLLALLFLKEAEMVPLRPMPASLAELSASVNTSVAKAGNTNVSTKLVTETIRKGTGIAMKKIIISFICVALLGAITLGVIFILNHDNENNDNEEPRKSRKRSVETVNAATPSEELFSTPTEELMHSFDKTALRAADIGSYVTFGKYEQDNDLNNGSEDIEWLVLAKEDNKILVISRYGLDCHEYNPTENVTWENCSLRTWLNTDFYDSAFGLREKSAIILSTVKAETNPVHGTPAGNDTTDRVFLLSINEAKQYFADNDARICPATAYVASKTTNLLDGNCWWWLRSPGYDLNNAAGVIGWGGVESQGSRVWGKTPVVRPAVWISVEP